MQHRLFVAWLRADIDPEVAHEHWHSEHGRVFAATPGLRGYRQNRPDGTAPVVCSETWFEDRDAERAAYAGDYYRDVVAGDEAGFLRRDDAWGARVTTDLPEPVGSGRRLLWFGDAPPRGVAWVPVGLDRQVPAPGSGCTVHVADVAAAEAERIVAAAPVLALACESVGFVVGDVPASGAHR